MNINITVIIQACNFMITYWMLRSLLFKPVIAVIHHEHAEKANILDIIDQQQKSLEIQEKERQRRWYVCQEYFKQQYLSFPPAHTHSTEITSTIAQETTPLPADEINHIIADLGSIIEEKLKHVH